MVYIYSDMKFISPRTDQSIGREFCYVYSKDLDQLLYKFKERILWYDKQIHNYFTNYYTITCFDTIVWSSDIY
jgi:hypothetical protein